MCDYLVGGCGSSSSSPVNQPPYKDPSGTYWDISGIVDNIPQVSPYTGGFKLYKGVWGSPSRHFFRTLKAGSGVTLTYDNEADNQDNSVIISASGGSGLPNGGTTNRGLVWDQAGAAWEVANYSNGLGIEIAATNLIKFIGGTVNVPSLNMASVGTSILSAPNNNIVAVGGTSGDIVLDIQTGTSTTHKLKVNLRDGAGAQISGTSGQALVSDGAGGVTWGSVGGTVTASNGLGVLVNDVRIVGGQNIAVGTLGAVFTTSDLTVGATLGFEKGTDHLHLAGTYIDLFKNNVGFLTFRETNVSLKAVKNAIPLEIEALGTGSNINIKAESGTIDLNSVLGKAKIKAPVWADGVTGPVGYGTETHILGSTALGEVRWVENTSGLKELPPLGEGDTFERVVVIDQNGDPVTILPSEIGGGGGNTTTEFSYRFSQGDIEVTDLFIDGFEITEIASMNTNVLRMEVNGGGLNLLQVGDIVPANSTVRFTITYQSGFNEAVLAIKGNIIWL
jgi:hypothetical protein